MYFKQDAGFLCGCLRIARIFLYPSFLSFNWLLCLYITTFQENKNPSNILKRKIFLTPIYASLFILFLPLMIIFLPLRCLLLYYRRPFMCSEHHTAYTHWQSQILNEKIDSGDHKFGIATANLCLMPELASKMNDLTNVSRRAKKIGERIVVNQFYNDEWSKSESSLKNPASNKNVDGKFLTNVSGSGDGNNRGKQKKHEDIQGIVSTNFPFVDIFVIQEAWSSYHNPTLMQELHKVFPYIIHDAGVHSYENNLFFLNSGLLIASRHPIVAVDFKPFVNFVKHGRLLSNGLLMAKVVIGREKSEKRHVGYIFNTHLQSYQGKDQIIPKQLDEMLAWIKLFKEENKQKGDNIIFSIICGDFNFDNFSPADKESSRHPVFSEFTDFGRLKAGLDKPWTVGTEMRPEFMLEKEVATPERLKFVLEDPILRQCHLVDADILEHSKEAIVSGGVKRDAEGKVIVFPEGGRRRIDYILTNDFYPVNVESYSFVTKLALLTDHIPVAMSFTCQNLK
ncbi:unnamed protein product [Lymnaea stagnalis]|uniref:sphingomyelin phosphodiesterase n=1 Tax=Lymnaea stagnalis TaxID=6523 RepID=A0AAV2IKI4_LYMST